MVVVRDVLRDRLYSRHTLPYCQCGVAVQFLLAICINYPSQYSNFLFYLLIQRHEEPRVASSSLPVQWNHYCSLSGSFPPFGTKTARLAKHKVTESKIFQWINGGNSEWCHSSFLYLTPEPLNPSYGKTQAYIYKLIWSTHCLQNRLLKCLDAISYPSP